MKMQQKPCHQGEFIANLTQIKLKNKKEKSNNMIGVVILAISIPIYLYLVYLLVVTTIEVISAILYALTYIIKEGVKAVYFTISFQVNFCYFQGYNP